MTFKQFATGVFYLPALALSGITALTFGATYLDKEGEERNFRGLFGLAVDGVRAVANFAFDAAKFVARGITNFIANHQKAIAVAFWSSLVVAGAAALAVAFWPAALAAVTGFTVGGVSIASLVGTGYLAQVGAVAGVAAVATSAAVYVSAAFINTINAIASLFSSRKGGGTPPPQSGGSGEPDADHQTGRNPLSGLNNDPANNSGLRSGTSSEASSDDQPPALSKPLFPRVVPVPEGGAPHVAEEQSNSMGCQ